jgi:hypothetical protein
MVETSGAIYGCSVFVDFRELDSPAHPLSGAPLVGRGAIHRRNERVARWAGDLQWPDFSDRDLCAWACSHPCWLPDAIARTHKVLL